MSQRDSFRIGVAVVALVAALAAGCGGDDESANTGGSGGTGDSAAEIQRGGDLVIARTQESLSMDKTTVFDNESIWIFQQMYETLYTVAEDGQDVKPWLAESYELSEDQKTYTFHLRKGVKFHNGQEMTSADVKFSLDDATSTKGGWEFINAAIKSVEAPDP
jgi:peptide/nickel transport system substrate-binding protein